MNKEGFITELSKITGLDENKCTIINSILEDSSLIGKASKDKIIKALKEKLKLSDKQAEEVYEKAMSLVTKTVTKKITDMFKKKKD